MVAVKIFVEGGGDYKRLERECRKAFSEFFKKAGFQGKMPRVVACGGRKAAFDDFCVEHRKTGNKYRPFLLVDSEDPVEDQHEHKPWAHLKTRPADNWDKPDGAQDEQAHLMVQCMESWFLADRKCLTSYFGPYLQTNTFPNNPDIEKIPKKQVLDALKKASRNTQKGKYDKGAHSFKILGMVDPEKVAECSWAKRLINTLKKVKSVA